MKITIGTFSAVISATLGALVGATAVAAHTPAETLRFAIMRNGEQIGTHAIEISRTGPETNVRITTDLSVKVLFVTAYRLQHSATERWVNGQLVSFDSTTDNNGVRHKISATRGTSGLEVEADGKTSRVDQNLFPASAWNPELYAMQDGAGHPRRAGRSHLGYRRWHGGPEPRRPRHEGALLRDQGPVMPHGRPKYRYSPISEPRRRDLHWRCGPCGGRLWVGKGFLHACSSGRSSHVFGLLARFT